MLCPGFMWMCKWMCKCSDSYLILRTGPSIQLPKSLLFLQPFFLHFHKQLGTTTENKIVETVMQETGKGGSVCNTRNSETTTQDTQLTFDRRSVPGNKEHGNNI